MHGENSIIEEKYKSEDEFTIVAVLVTGYILLQILANLTVAKTVPIFSLSLPIGSLLYAVSFTWMDVINHRLGIKNVRTLIMISTVVHVLISLWLNLYIYLPTNDWSQDSFEASALEYVFGSYFRITFASILTGFISGNINAFIFYKMKSSGRFSLCFNSIVSNTCAAALDGLLFYLLAFSVVNPWNSVIKAAVSSMLYKCAIAIVSVPLLLLAKKTHIITGGRSDEDG